MKKLLKKNKGFSLVELIVSFAILSMIALTVLGLMTTSTNIFTKVDEEINIQYKHQNAMTQFQQYFMGCSKAICNMDNNILYYADNKNVYALKFENGKLYYAEVTYSEADALTAENITDPFCGDVENFTATITSSEGKATSIRVTLSLKDESGKSYSSSQIFSLRNQPIHIKEADTSEDEAATMLSTLIKVLEG